MNELDEIIELTPSIERRSSASIQTMIIIDDHMNSNSDDDDIMK